MEIWQEHVRTWWILKHCNRNLLGRGWMDVGVCKKMVDTEALQRELMGGRGGIDGNKVATTTISMKHIIIPTQWASLYCTGCT